MDNEAKQLGQSIKSRLSTIKDSLGWHSIWLFLLLLATCHNSPKNNYQLEKKVDSTNELLKEIRDELRKPRDRQTNDYLWNMLKELRKSNEQPVFGPYHLKAEPEQPPVEK